jgi:hypothetical protein
MNAMSPRERNLAIGIVAIIVLGGGGFGGYTFVYSPLEDTNAAIQQLRDEIDGTAEKQGLENRVMMMKKAGPQIAMVKRESLPLSLDVAKTQYRFLLERLLKQAKITDVQSPTATELASKAPVTPELAPKKPAYTRLQFAIDIHKVTIWQIADFLYEFYQLDLLHQITELKITRHNKPKEMRNGLEAHIVIEALILDGAEQKATLFPVVSAGRLTSSGEAVAAIGGGRAVEAVAANPELSRRVTALTNAPVLATRSRDYSLIARKDIFYGMLPDKPPPALSIVKIEDMQIRPGQPIPPVKVIPIGEGSEDVKVTALASYGSLLPQGPLKVDPVTHTISFPPVNEEAASNSLSGISVVATSADGKKQAKTNFKVEFAQGASLKDDIASVIKLTMITGSSDGIVTAQIIDNANPFKYVISANAKTGIGVVRFEQVGFKWKEQQDYKYPPGILTFTDDSTRTKRTLKVVAIEYKSLIVADLGKPDPKTDPKTTRGGGRGPGGGGAPPRRGPADPLSALLGNAATAVPVTVTVFPRFKITAQVVEALKGAKVPEKVLTKLNSVKDRELSHEDFVNELAKALSADELEQWKHYLLSYSPVLFRWTMGMSLLDLEKAKISPEEVRKIVENIALNGPVDVAVSTIK